MPTRRALLQSLAGIPLAPLVAVDGEAKSAAAAIAPGRYMIFFDTRAIDVDILIESPCPPGVTMDLVPLWLMNGQTIDDAVKIYKLDEK